MEERRKTTTITPAEGAGVISVLCADSKSNYYKIPYLDIWDKERDVYNYTGKNQVIAHPPCQQWSRLRKFAKIDDKEKNLALLCWDIVNENGGILEHPMGSNLFKYVGADYKKIHSVNQHWWGFPCKKTTYLYVHNVELLPYNLNFNAIEKTVDKLNTRMRSRQTLAFCEYLVNSILLNSPQQ